jgi:hypothetical protein
MRRGFDAEKVLQTPGVTESIKNVKQRKELTEKECEKLHSTFRSHAKGSQGGGGFSCGLFSLGGGGGEWSQIAEADKKYLREFYRHFLESLDSYATTGKWPVHPHITYTIVSSSKIEKGFEQKLTLARAGKVSRRVLSSTCNTSRPVIFDTPKALERAVRDLDLK